MRPTRVSANYRIRWPEAYVEPRYRQTLEGCRKYIAGHKRWGPAIIEKRDLWGWEAVERVDAEPPRPG
jgi:hypothetical protein